MHSFLSYADLEALAAGQAKMAVAPHHLIHEIMTWFLEDAKTRLLLIPQAAMKTQKQLVEVQRGGGRPIIKCSHGK